MRERGNSLRLALLALPAWSVVGAPAPTAQQAIDEYIRAEGGAKTIAQIHSETISGNLTEESTGKTGSWSLITSAPDRFYMEMIAGPDRIVEAYNGRSAWGENPADGLHTLTGEAAKQTESAAHDSNERLADVKKSKLTLQFAGNEKVRGKDAWHIQVTRGPGTTRELYFDPNTHLIVREILPGEEFEYDDYRPVHGIQVPFRIDLRRDGKVYTISVTRAEFNSGVEDSIFDFPRKSSTPLPDIATLIHEVTRNQNAIDELQKQYTCHVTEELPLSGMIREYEVFNIGGEEVRHLVAKGGTPLAGDAKKKADERFNRQFEKAKKRDDEAARDPKKQAKQEEKDDAQISDFLRAVTFANARRERLRGQDVIAVDFGPNPDFKPKKMAENMIHQMAGVIWIDEKALDVARLEAHFAGNVKIAGGVVGSLEKGSSFVFEQAKINDEVWLPTYDEVHLGGRFLVLKVKADQIDRYTDYRKFRAESTFVPDPN